MVKKYFMGVYGAPKSIFCGAILGVLGAPVDLRKMFCTLVFSKKIVTYTNMKRRYGHFIYMVNYLRKNGKKKYFSGV